MPAFSFAFLYRTITIGKRFQIPVVALIWLGVSLVATLAKVLHAAPNNYFVYQGVFYHVLHQTNLYAPYPGEYYDTNYYGPVFSFIIAPFALLPWKLGCTLWGVANAAFLYYAVMQLTLPFKQRTGVLLIGFLELITSLQNVQFNPMLTAWIVLAFVLVHKEKEWAATLFIAAGFLVKLYGIIALVTFLFSRNKVRFVIWFTIWMVVLFCLPMLISSPRFIVQSYIDWFTAVTSKNEENIAQTLEGGPQDISVPGMVRRIFRQPYFSGLWTLVPAAALYLLPLLRWKHYQSTVYQLLYAAASLILVVIFSSSAESPTYVIAMIGVGIWFVVQPYPPARWAIAALVFALLLTSLSPTDLFPRYVRTHFVTRYSLKALPCLVVWLAIMWQLLRWPFHEYRPEVGKSGRPEESAAAEPYTLDFKP